MDASVKFARRRPGVLMLAKAPENASEACRQRGMWHR